MNVSFVTVSPVPSRLDAGSLGSAIPAALDQAPSKVDTSSSVPSQAGSSGMDETHNVPSLSQLARAVSQVNDAFSQKGQNLYASFEKDKITGIHMVKIVEKKTNEIIRQMPPKEVIAFAQTLEASQGGRGQLILDKA